MNAFRIAGVAAFVLLGIRYLRPGNIPMFAAVILVIMVGGLRSKHVNVLSANLKLLFLLFWCYLLVQLVDLLRSMDLKQGFIELLKYGGLIASLYIFARFYDFSKMRKDVKLFAILSSFLLLVFFVNSLLVLKSPFMSADFFLRTEQGKNGLAMFSAISCIVSFWLLISEKGSVKYIIVPCLLVSVASLVYTQSRGALIVLVISMLVVFLSYLRSASERGAFKIIRISFVVAALVIYLVLIFSSLDIFDARQYVADLTSLGTGRFTGSDEVRRVLIEKGWRGFLDNPLIGIGTNNFLFTNGLLTHNQYLQFAVENGFFIAFAIIVLFAAFTRKFYRRQVENSSNGLFQVAFNVSLFIFLYFIFINAYDSILTEFCLVLSVAVLDGAGE